MRVVLIQPPPSRPDMPALGLPCLQAALRAAGIETVLRDASFALFEAATDEEQRIFDPSLHTLWHPRLQGPARALVEREAPLLDRLLEEALGETPTLVGITVLNAQKPAALYLAARVKALRPGLPVVLGGASCFPAWSPRALLRDPAVDFVVVGEGEATVVELARHVAAGARGPLPAGVLRSTGGGHGDVEAGPERPLIADLNSLPFPDFDGLPMAHYLDRVRIPLMSSRGCVRRCVYCTEHRMWQRYRVRSAESVVTEIRRNVEQLGATKIEFNDSLFNGHPAMLAALCDQLIEAGLDVSWGGEGIIHEAMTPDLLGTLRRAGCEYITYGLESASPAVQQRMGKSIEQATIARVIRDTHAAGIRQKLNLMVGFPGETEVEFEETLSFLSAHADWIDEINPSDAFTGILPGTELYEHAAEHGVRFVNQPFFWETVDGTNTLAVRLQRFEHLLAHAGTLGLPTTYGANQLYNRHQLLGDFHLNREEHADALTEYERHAAALALDPAGLPELELAALGSARTLERAGRLDEALAELARLDRHGVGPERAARLHLRLLCRLGRADEAAVLLAGRIQGSALDPRRVLEAYRAQLAAHPEPDHFYADHVGPTDLSTEDRIELLAFDLNWALALGPDLPEADPFAQWLRATALENEGRPASALAVLDSLTATLAEPIGAVLDTRGALLCRLERHAEAAESLQRALDLEPGRSETTCALAYCRFRLDEVEAATALARAVQEQEPSDLGRFLVALFAGRTPRATARDAPPEPQRHLRSARGHRLSYHFLPDEQAAALRRFVGEPAV